MTFLAALGEGDTEPALVFAEIDAAGHARRRARLAYPANRRTEL